MGSFFETLPLLYEQKVYNKVDERFFSMEEDAGPFFIPVGNIWIKVSIHYLDNLRGKEA